MEEILVSFETAKLAQEKGFNIRTNLGFSLRTKQLVPWSYHVLKCSCPTQSLLQKWLREVHNINLFVDTSAIKGKYIVYINDYGWIHNDKDVKTFDSYEQALEAGLQEALKLIE